MSRRSFLMKMGAGVAAARVTGFGVAMSGAGSVGAQSRKPITLMVGFPPGGGPDLVARAVAEPARRDLGQAIVIENRIGASGRIALDWLRKAEGNGSNFVLTPASMLTAYPQVYKRLSYSLAEFAPVCKLCRYHLSVVAPANAPYSTLQEFVAWARSSKEATFGVPGQGNATEFTGRLLAQAENLSLEPISYRGGPQLTQAVAAGEVNVAVNLSSNFIELIKAGRLKVLAVTTAARSPFSPDVPTLVELGYPDIVFEEFIGIVARNGTPEPGIVRLQDAMQAALQDATVRDTLSRSEYLPDFKPARLLGADLAASSERWKALVREIGFKPIE